MKGSRRRTNAPTNYGQHIPKDNPGSVPNFTNWRELADARKSDVQDIVGGDFGASEGAADFSLRFRSASSHANTNQTPSNTHGNENVGSFTGNGAPASGGLQFEDFYLLIKDLEFGRKMNAIEAMQLFKSEDKDKDGYMLPSEFQELCQRYKKELQDARCQRPYPVENSEYPLGGLTGTQYVRQYVHLTLEEFEFSTASRVVGTMIMFLIVISTLSFMLESMPKLKDHGGFFYIEWVVTMVFTAEYIVRGACCRNPRQFVFNRLNMIDLLSFLPFYIELSGVLAGASVGYLRVVRTLRLTRMVRMMKLEIFAEYMQIFADTLNFAKHSFSMLGVLFMFPLVICSCLIFSVEQTPDWTPAQPILAKSTYNNVFDSIYWTIITMTTLGYGDQYPKTTMGKVIACATVLMGIMYLTFAINIIGGSFDEAYGRYLRRIAKKKKAGIRRVLRKEQDRRDEENRRILEHNMNVSRTPTDKDDRSTANDRKSTRITRQISNITPIIKQPSNGPINIMDGLSNPMIVRSGAAPIHSPSPAIPEDRRSWGAVLSGRAGSCRNSRFGSSPLDRMSPMPGPPKNLAMQKFAVRTRCDAVDTDWIRSSMVSLNTTMTILLSAQAGDVDSDLARKTVLEELDQLQMLLEQDPETPVGEDSVRSKSRTAEKEQADHPQPEAQREDSQP